MDELKQIIADNIAFYRREMGLTQAELADKLNYSDKAVSKWERGESYPDIATLAALAKMFGITVDTLIADRKKKVKKIKPLIALLSMGLVWLVATAAYVILNMIFPSLPKSWLAFIYAIPVCAIVLLIFFSIWDLKLLILISESVIIWTIAVCIYLTIPPYNGAFYIFFLPIPLEVLAILWYVLRARRKTNHFKRNRVKKGPKTETKTETDKDDQNNKSGMEH